MPIYVYRCSRCQRSVEKIERITDSIKERPSCSQCGRLMSKTITQTLPPRVKGGTPKFHSR
jgi:putative FmdB family regulatory protein